MTSVLLTGTQYRFVNKQLSTIYNSNNNSISHSANRHCDPTIVVELYYSIQNCHSLYWIINHRFLRGFFKTKVYNYGVEQEKTFCRIICFVRGSMICEKNTSIKSAVSKHYV